MIPFLEIGALRILGGLVVDEASKTLSLYSTLLMPFLQGKILDIGAGIDPITKDAVIFDKEQGDAQVLDQYFPSGSFDTVFSSHCLEHMVNPGDAIKSWFSLVKPGGFLITIVPDEDLYEQGHFPSIFNSDHKATFTLSKSHSWSPVSYNCLDLANKLNGKLVYSALQSDNYDLRRRTFGKLGVLRFRIFRVLMRLPLFSRVTLKLRLRPIDQTSGGINVLAQNCFIVQKSLEN
ncbi:MAG TPA: class I SAM-dependent methyltransferase [Candidatus Paceibacterota bacterium]|nr:class I SAM-dependent methyltransferase [Candidatus Paceibacterota bacterium]